MKETIYPSLNLTWYKNEDQYSEGSVEDSIIDIIENTEPEVYSAALLEQFSWPVFYHLTHLRKNILNWYPFESSSHLLEIGCGMGALTGMFCDFCEKVTAVELSKRRARATQLRCREKENLEILVGNLNDIEWTNRYDYITLIGVLEYQNKFTNSKQPFLDFLIKIKGLLNPGGKLFIAIENKFGLKYWCGAPEDHSGIPFDGINQYRFTKEGAKTFSKAELKQLLKQAGLSNMKFYYPLPDYKLPNLIFSENYLPKENDLLRMVPYYFPNNQTLVADETKLYQELIQNQTFEFFANSFLVECSTEELEHSKVDFISCSTQRMPEYRIHTLIEKEGKVRKMGCSKQVIKHLKESDENLIKLEKRGIPVVKHLWQDGEAICNFVQAPLLQDVILGEAREGGDKQKLFGYFDLLFRSIKQSSDEAEKDHNFIYELGLAKPGEFSFGRIVKTAYLDMVAHNCFFKGDELIFMDQEWTLPDTPENFVMYRMLIEIYGCNNWLLEVLPLIEVANRYGLVEVWEVYGKLQSCFYEQVVDHHHAAAYRNLQRPSGEYCEKNIAKLLK